MANFGLEKVVILRDNEVNDTDVDSLKKALLKLRYAPVIAYNLDVETDIEKSTVNLNENTAWLVVQLFAENSHKALSFSQTEYEYQTARIQQITPFNVQLVAFLASIGLEITEANKTNGNREEKPYVLALGVSKKEQESQVCFEEKFVRLPRNSWVSEYLPENNDLEESYLQILQFVMDPHRRSNTAQLESFELLNELLQIKERKTNNRANPGGPEWRDSCFKQSVEKSLADELGFESDTRKAFKELLSDFGKNGWATEIDFFVIVYNLLRGMTMARRLSSWSLEGEKFNCRIVMIKKADEYEGVLGNSANKVFSANSNIIFNLSCEKQVREFAELGIGDSLCLVVEMSTNRIISVTSRDSSPFHNEKSHIVIHVRPDERVDVFNSDGKVALNWDGFRWKPNPISVLIKSLIDHITDEQTRTTIVQATSKLLNGGYSSIFMIVDQKDIANCEVVSDKSLRSGLLPPYGLFATIDVKKIGSDSLFCLLKLDGAHFIDTQGKLFRICGNLKAKSDAWHDFSVTSIVPQTFRDDMRTISTACEESFTAYQTSLLSQPQVEPQVLGQQLRQFESNRNKLDGILTELKNFLCEPAPSEVFDLITVDKDFTVAFSSPLISNIAGVVNSLRTHPVGNQSVSTNVPSAVVGWMIGDDGNKQFKKLILDSLGLKKLDKGGIQILALTIDIKDGDTDFRGGSGTLNAPDESNSFWFSEKPGKHRLTIAIAINDILNVQKSIIESKWIYAHAVSQVISQWLRTGSISEMENSGTGTRAALAASKAMPNSLVVKVSASGKLMVYKNGKSLET